MIKFYASNFGAPSIRKVDVTRETSSFVYVVELKFGKKVERRQAKQTQSDGFFDTFDDAKNFIISQLTEKRNYFMRNLDQICKRIDEVSSMQQ